MAARTTRDFAMGRENGEAPCMARKDVGALAAEIHGVVDEWEDWYRLTPL